MKLKEIKIESQIGSICLFLLASILIAIFKNPDFTLDDFSNLYLGQATLDGIDATKRVSLLYNVLILSGFILPGLYISISKLKQTGFLLNRDLQTLSIISTTGFFLILADIMQIENTFTVFFFQSLFGLTTLYILVRNLFNIDFAFYTLYPFTTTISFVCLQLGLLLFNTTDLITQNAVVVYSIILFLLNGLVYLSKRILGVSYQQIFRFLWFTCLIPLVSFFSIELLFWYKTIHDVFIPYKIVLAGILFVSFVINFILVLKKKINLTPTKALNRYFIPSALLSFLLLTVYLPFQKQPQELFELANSANAIMKIFRFNEIPFIDFFNSHVAFDFVFGSIYTLIFGYQENLDFLSYNFIYTVLIFFIVLAFNKKIFKSSIIALIFTVSFPFFGSLYYHSMMFGLLAFLIAYRLVKDQSIKNYLFLFGNLIALLFWRLDTGIAALFSIGLFLPTYFILENQKVNWSNLLKSTGITILIGSMAVVIAAVIKTPELLWDNFIGALIYVKANQAHAYTLVANQMNQQFYLYYVFIPALSFITVLYIIFTLKKKGTEISTQNKYLLLASLFLFVIFFFNIQRGIIRHGFMEHTEGFLTSTFFLAIMLFLMAINPFKSKSHRYFLFFGIGFFLITVTKYFPFSPHKSMFEKLLRENTLAQLDLNFNPDTYSSRVIENKAFANKNYINLKIFLDKQTSQKQTFLDFSNTPMLHFYTQKNVPGYFCQNLQNTVDDYLQIQHLKMLNPTDVPVTIFSNYPPNGYDHMDGVPGTLRHYLIAEYIFKNYIPYQVIDQRSIWTIPGFAPTPLSGQIDTISVQPQTHHYKYAALAIQEHFSKTKNRKHIQLIQTIPSPLLNDTIPIDPDVHSISHLFMSIQLSSPQNFQNVTVDLLSHDEIIATNTFITKSDYNAYMIRLSNHYLWHKEKVTSLVIHSNQSNIAQIEFYKDLRLEHSK
ncbi:hypothetical protein KFE94_00525 [bacterium SCSIO 12643]|nr:hypothetical protein KFE94_00525 [bacterium SCSIO 12643]